MTTKIEWTDKTWNPVTGCSKISPGCAHCYAERMAKRLAGRFGYDKDNPFRITSHEGRYEEPFAWNDPKMIFACSMGDLFHDDVPVGCQIGVYETISDDRAQHHTFQILTKRPENMEAFHHDEVVGTLPNLWLGVTAENQEWADKRIPILLQIPAAVRFVSIEPMLSDMLIKWWLDGQHESGNRPDWIICGPETGPGRRPCELGWIESIVDQCHAAGVPVFVKALPGKRPVKDAEAIAGVLRCKVEDIRQFPRRLP